MSKATKEFACVYASRCASAQTERCKICMNNTMRNFRKDYFNKAQDTLMFEMECPKLKLEENGYKCPVCGNMTPVIELVDKYHCKWCGFRLNID